MRRVISACGLPLGAGFETAASSAKLRMVRLFVQPEDAFAEGNSTLIMDRQAESFARADATRRRSLQSSGAGRAKTALTLQGSISIFRASFGLDRRSRDSFANSSVLETR